MMNLKSFGKERAAAGCMVLGLLTCAVLFALRVSGAVTLDRPFLGNTSGLEEEALFSVWKAHHDQPIYTDALAAPFSTSYFNWLFYAVYALWGKLWCSVWPAADAWLPTIWRTLSLVFCLSTWLILWRSVFKEPTATQGRAAGLLAFGAAGVCMCNPLFNWMSFSVRPDVAAVFCEVAGFALLLRHVRQPSWKCLVLAGLAVALAWSFKQSQVFLLAGGFVYLGWHRCWRELAAFTGPLIVAVPVTLWLCNEWYYQNTILLHALVSQFDPAQGFKLAASAMAKAPFMLIGALLLAPLALRWRMLTPELRLAVMMVAASLPLGLVTASKVGAGDYYYLAPSVFAAVLVFAAVRWLRQPEAGLSKWLNRAAAGGLVLQIIAVGLIFTGRLGRVSIRGDQALTVRLQQRLQDEQGPLLITGRPYNLPWLHAGRPAFVFSYLYDEYERRYPERLLQQQGLRPLIQQCYFRLVVAVEDPPLDFSQELAAVYTLTETGDGFRIYRPRQP